VSSLATATATATAAAAAASGIVSAYILYIFCKKEKIN
jgi:hypothetical protein